MTEFHWGGKRRLVIVHNKWEGSVMLPPNSNVFVWMENNTPHYSENYPFNPETDRATPRVVPVVTDNKQIKTIDGFPVIEIYKERGL